MWLEESVHVREEFLRQLAGTVSVERCDFLTAPEAARQAINNEIAEQTAGKITGLIPKGAIDPATRLVLTNAVYLKALWVHQFPVKDTKKRDFYPERTGPSPVDMMHLQERLAYHRGDGYEAVLLPYRDGSLAMAVVLPDGPLSDFTGTLAGAGGIGALLDGLLSSGSEALVDLSLPRFRAEASFQLTDTLQALGVRAAFTSAADFSGIADESLHISAVVHKAYVDVAEEGTEAAAATAAVFAMMAVLRKPQPDVQLVFDRPFLFLISDTASGLPLFLGQFTRPGSA
jgi:serpin B